MNVRFGCQCYAVEPNPTLWNKIPEIDRIHRFNLAISGSTGSALFDVSDNLECSHLQGDGRPAEGAPIAVQTATLVDFARDNGLAKIDLLKVDIEGAEFDMFDSLSDEFLSGIGQIAVEFHDFIRALACDMAVARVKARLRRLGFACIVFSRANNGDVLFVNRAVYPGTPLQWFYLENVARYTRGFVRMADRWLHPITASSGR
jgi:FkbM family methyltransferase